MLPHSSGIIDTRKAKKLLCWQVPRQPQVRISSTRTRSNRKVNSAQKLESLWRFDSYPEKTLWRFSHVIGATIRHPLGTIAQIDSEILQLNRQPSIKAEASGLLDDVFVARCDRLFVSDEADGEVGFSIDFTDRMIDNHRIGDTRIQLEGILRSVLIA